MSTLRINLHIRSDVVPRLYAALATMPPKPRAEFLRKIAELGLQIAHRPAPSSENSKTMVANPDPHAQTDRAVDSAPDAFGADLVSAIRGSL